GWLLVAKQVETTADAWNLRIPNYLCQQQDKLRGVRRRFPTHRASSTKQRGSSKRSRLSWMSFSLCRRNKLLRTANGLTTSLRSNAIVFRQRNSPVNDGFKNLMNRRRRRSRS